MQIPLLPIKLVDEQPASAVEGRDLLFTAHDEQGRKYALKTGERNQLLPITEWICYHLCRQIGILTPEFDVVQRLDGTLVFGSRWESQASQYSPSRVSDAEFMAWIRDAKADICSMFALDAFMPNEDRHFGNMLFVDTGRDRAMAFDWSRAKLFKPWPWPSGCGSVRAWSVLVTTKMHDLNVVAARLNRLRQVTGDTISSIIKSAPPEWTPGTLHDDLVIWWDGQKDERAEQALKLLSPP